MRRGAQRGWVVFLALLAATLSGCGGGGGGGGRGSQQPPANDGGGDGGQLPPPLVITGYVYDSAPVVGAEIELFGPAGTEIAARAGRAAPAAAISDGAGAFRVEVPATEEGPFLVKASAGERTYYSLVLDPAVPAAVNPVADLVLWAAMVGTADGGTPEGVFSSFVSDAGDGIRESLARRVTALAEFLARGGVDAGPVITGDNPFEAVFTAPEEDVSRIMTWLARTDVGTWFDTARNAYRKRRGTVSGVVREIATGNPILGATVRAEGVYAEAITDRDGLFSLEGIPASERVAVTVEASGYAQNQVILSVPDANARSARKAAINVALKPVAVSIPLAGGVPTAGLSLGRFAEPGVARFETPDGALRVDLPLPVLSRVAARAAGDEGAEGQLRLEMTGVDPSAEREVFPGDFSATEGRGEASDTTLESVALAEITIRDSAGEEVQLLPGERVPIRLRIPENLQAKYREEYEQGIRSVPWWSYDPAAGVWQLEGDAYLVDVDGVLYAEGVASHFSWWNVDKPIRTHARLCGKVVDGGENPLPGAIVTAEGVDYEGNSTATAGPDGSYELRVKRLSTVRLTATFGKIGSSARVVSVEDVGIEQCQDQDSLVVAAVTVEGIAQDEGGTPLAGALVVVDGGDSTYTDDEGKFRVLTTPGSKASLKAVYVVGGRRNEGTAEVEVAGDAVTGVVIVVDTRPVAVRGRVLLTVNGFEQGFGGVTVSAPGGQVGRTGDDGTYQISMPRSGNPRPVTLLFRGRLPSGVYAERTLDLLVGGDDVEAPTVIFEDAVSHLVGRVLNADGAPMEGVGVVTSHGGAAMTGPDGSYSVAVPVGEPVWVEASHRDPFADRRVSARSPEVRIPEGTEEYPLPDLVLDTRPAFVVGTVRSAVRGETAPLPGVKVTTEYGGYDVTDELGRYRVRAPVERVVSLKFSYEYLDADGERRRWGEPVSLEVETGGPGTEVQLDCEMPLTSHPPIFRSLEVMPRTAAPGDTVTLRAEVEDPDGDDVTVTWYDGDLAVSTGNEATWQAPEGEGLYRLRVVADDGVSVRVSRSVDVTVRENAPPVIVGAWLERTVVRPGDALRATVRAFDPDGDPLRYVWRKDGQETQTDTSKVELAVPESAAEGEYTLVVEVRDFEAEGRVFDSRSLSYRVKRNLEPRVEGLLVTPPDPVPGQTVVLAVVASDPDGDALSYRWTDSEGTELGSAKTLLWTAPDVAAPTPFAFAVSVSDGEYAVRRAVELVVSPPPEGEPPTVEGDTIAGFVWDQDGSPIAGALVELYNEDRSVDLRTATDTYGFYAFEGVPPGRYYVVVARDGFTRAATVVVVE